MLKRALLAVPIGALLAGSLVTGTAMAQNQDEGLVADLCAAGSIGGVNALLSANLDVGLPAGVRDAVDPSVAGGTLEQVQSRLGCAEQPSPGTGTPDPDEPGDDNIGAGTDVPPAEQPRFDNCVDAIAAGSIQPATRGVDPGYQANLDPNGNGVSCEADETAGGPAPGTGDDSTGSGSNDGSGTLGGDSGSSGGSDSVDSVPRGSIDTGYAPR